MIDYKTAVATGAKRYHTGKTCKNGHINAARYTASRVCVECDRHLWRRVRQAIPGKVRRIYVRVPADVGEELLAEFDRYLQRVAVPAFFDGPR